jgi:Fe-S cluster assembly iron-binding protein IscA
MTQRLAKLAVLLLLALPLVGCDYIEELLGTGKPNLTVTSVEALTNATTGEITGARVVIKNTGTADAAGVKYNVMLTDDAAVSSTDTLIYSASVDLVIDQEKQIDITNAETALFMGDNAITAPANGKYYLGASVDPDDGIVEKLETDNEGVSAASVWYIGGVPMAYVVQGSIIIPANLTYNSGTPLPTSGAIYTVYCFSMLMGTTLPTAGVPANLSDYLLPGSVMLTVQYFGDQLTINYTCGIPKTGQYYICAILDADKDGKLLMIAIGPPTDPWGVWPETTGAPVYQNITENAANANITLSPGGNLT